MSTIRAWLVAAVGLAIPGLLLASAWGAAQQTARPQRVGRAGSAEGGRIAPYVTWRGRDSAIESPEYLRIGDAAAWERFWQRHSGRGLERDNVGGAFLPCVDFGQCTVVAIVIGKSVNSNGVMLAEIRDEADCLRLRFDESTFQTEGPGPRGGAVDVRPYGIFVLPRSNKPMVLEENVQGRKGGEAQWKERARLP